ncbi:MAG: hypothetical protein MJ180_02310 [Candidatus Gastranaerophilales bacterium]|nr:hypothetical protein [Candidatus Gastranaerophilales bacterium]
MKKFLILIIFLLTINSVSAEEPVPFQLNATVAKNVIFGDIVVYNLSNGKLHLPDCEWAQKCTKNCIYIKKKDLKKMFFVPCIVCGGGVVEPAEINEEE